MAKILVVEDNYYTRIVLARRLVRRGYDVVTAIDGEEALRLTRAEHPDVILLDVRLPLLDGWDVVRQLKADPETSSIPVIAMSAYGIDGSRERAMAAECAGYEPKPVDLHKLLVQIDALLGSRPAPASPEA